MNLDRMRLMSAQGIGEKAPKTVKELVAAWQLSGRQARHLRVKLRELAQHAQKYRRDLLFLVQQNQHRKQQAEDLRARLVAVLERQNGAGGGTEIALPQPADGESVPAPVVHSLLKRLRESQAILEEYDTLLQFRENQVQELLGRVQSAPEGGAGNQDFVVAQLRKQLSQARHRIRLLTRELTQSQGVAAASPALAEYQERVRQLEELLGQFSSGSVTPQALQEKDAQLLALANQVGPLQEAVQKLQAAFETAQRRVLELESRPVSEGASDSNEEILQELASLQDEVGRLQEENELLRSNEGGIPPEVLEQITSKLNDTHRQLEEEQARRVSLEEIVREMSVLREENAALKAGAGDSQRAEKLEAAMVELRGKLQLAASKYQEVKQALLDKHRELNELKARSQETEKKSEFLVPVVQTLESALNEARQEVENLKGQLAQEKQRSATAAPASAPAAAGGEDLAAMEAKLKEARRSAVRAQAEAGVKRKEAAKLQEELNHARAALAAAEEKLKKAGIA